MCLQGVLTGGCPPQGYLCHRKQLAWRCNQGAQNNLQESHQVS